MKTQTLIPITLPDGTDRLVEATIKADNCYVELRGLPEWGFIDVDTLYVLARLHEALNPNRSGSK